MGSMCCYRQVLVDSLKMYDCGLCEHGGYYWLIYATYFYVYWEFGFVRRDQTLSLLTTTVCVHNSHSLMQTGVQEKKNQEIYSLIFCVCCSGYLHYIIFSSIWSLTTDHWCMDKAQWSDVWLTVHRNSVWIRKTN